MLNVNFFKALWGKKNAQSGIVAISFMPNGFAIAIADTVQKNQLKLIRCEFIPCLTDEEQEEKLIQWVRQFELSEYACHVVLSPSDYRRINIEAPSVADNEIIDAIRWKVNDLCDFPIDKAIIDYFAAPDSLRASSAKMLEVIVSPDDRINHYIKLCSEAGLNLKVIDIQETSLRNLAVLLSENKRGVAILHLLKTSGTLLIQKEGIIYLSRTFDLGYGKLNLEEQFSLDAGAAQEQKNLVLEIQRSLDYVESYYGMQPISVLAVIPLAEHTQYLLNVLNNNHGMIARVMDISAIVDCDNTLDDTLQSLCTPVIGATLRYITEQL